MTNQLLITAGPLLAAIDWGRYAGWFCLIAIVAAFVIALGGGPNFPGAGPGDD